MIERISQRIVRVDASEAVAEPARVQLVRRELRLAIQHISLPVHDQFAEVGLKELLRQAPARRIPPVVAA